MMEIVMSRFKPERRIRQELRATGLPWSLDHGRKHLKIVLAGKLVGVMSGGARISGTRGLDNLIASIKRAARGQAV